MSTDRKPDRWTEGYQAGLAGKQYTDNPYEGQDGASAWAFGCGEGWRERNRQAFGAIIMGMRA